MLNLYGMENWYVLFGVVDNVRLKLSDVCLGADRLHSEEKVSVFKKDLVTFAEAFVFMKLRNS